jgi:hypothetical protein
MRQLYGRNFLRPHGVSPQRRWIRAIPVGAIPRAPSVRQPGVGWVSRRRTSRHAVVGVWLSGQRRFVPRASTAVNYKFVPPGTKNGAATVRAMRMGAPAAGRGAEHVWALWGSPLQRLRRDSLRRCRPSGYGASHVGAKNCARTVPAARLAETERQSGRNFVRYVRSV